MESRKSYSAFFVKKGADCKLTYKKYSSPKLYSDGIYV